jgi:fructose-1,6-bisphosphatase I
MGEGIGDYTKNMIDLRRHMWMAGVEVELRRLIWQIAVVGKYISAKIHEANRKLAGFKNVYGEDQLSLDRSTEINCSSPVLSGNMHLKNRKR